MLLGVVFYGGTIVPLVQGDPKYVLTYGILSFVESPDDFIALRGVDLKFESGVHQICKSTRIYDDHRLEHFETFTVILEGHPDLDDRIKISSVEGLVEIRDINDGMT